jgi:hypothetical protein
MLIGLRKLFCEGEHTMSEPVTKSVAQEQQKQKIETRTAVERIAAFTIGSTAMAVLAVLVGAALFAQGQDKYSLKSPSRIAFSDFRGHEDWAVVSSARTDEVLKVIVAKTRRRGRVSEQSDRLSSIWGGSSAAAPAKVIGREAVPAEVE